MASPQVENGYVRIANELFEALCRSSISGQEWRVLMAIVRFTYGYQKRSDIISLSQITKMTNMDRRSVARSVKKLVFKKFILREQNCHLFCYKINKNFDTWLGVRLPPKVGAGLHGGEFTPTLGASLPLDLGATPVELLGASLPPTKDIKTKDNGNFEISYLKTETKTLKNIGWKNEKIRDHFLMREISPEIIEKVLKDSES